MVDELWFLDESVQPITESPGHVEDALHQGLQGVCVPRSPSESPTKVTPSAHGDSPRIAPESLLTFAQMSPRSPFTLASVRPVQSHVESEVSPAKESLASDVGSRHSGSNRESTDDKSAGLVQPVNDGIFDAQVFPPDLLTVAHSPVVECVVNADDMSAVASQSHLDTDPESVLSILRDDSVTVASLGAQSAQAHEDISVGVPASGLSPAGGLRQKQPKREPRSQKQPLKQKAPKK